MEGSRSKTKQFCALAIQTKPFCETSSKMESWVQRWRPCTNAVCDFSTPSVNLCKVIRLTAPATQNHLSKPEDLMLQNATPLRKSSPWPPNISDAHASSTAPNMHLCRSSSNIPLTPAIFFATATKLSRVAYFWIGAESIMPATENDVRTSKSGANMW